MTTTTQTAPQRPAPMDNTRINTPGEYRAWQDAESSYFATLRRIETAKQEAAEMEKAEACRILSEQDYYLMACQRENLRKEKAAATLAAEQEAAQAKADYLASRPATVEIMRGEPYNFLQEFAHWTRAGYVMLDSGMHSTGFGMWHATMTAPAAPAAAKGAK
ncbi:hypothetical protein [Polaromonas hydrogenivorans]|uniref:Uncharacterized protein n=1 Tax=Polaromonas hydrogenivorans TaxID=335476 RepID=A0AAU7LS14_9BURK